MSTADVEVEYRCFVGGLAWATDDRSLEQAFSSFGEIVDSKVKVSPDLVLVAAVWQSDLIDSWFLLLWWLVDHKRSGDGAVEGVRVRHL